MKKIIFVLVLISIILISSCGKKTTEPENKGFLEGGFLEGKVTINQRCPEGDFSDCKSESEIYKTRKIVIYTENRTSIIKEISLDQKGNYKTDLNAGNYLVDIVDINYFNVDKSSDVPKKVKIESGQTFTLNINIDVGIR